MKILIGLLILPVLFGLRWAKKKIFDEFVGYPSNPLEPVHRDGSNLQNKFKGKGRE